MSEGKVAEARRLYKRAFYHVDFDELQTFDMQVRDYCHISCLPHLIDGLHCQIGQAQGDDRCGATPNLVEPRAVIREAGTTTYF